ncbi:MAG: ATP-dependent protease, partial [Deferrisomatales bacterium]
CKAVGLTGTQGVVLPEANVRHLIVHPEVVDAVARGEFHLYPVRTVDEGMALLTGLPAGEPGQPGTVNGAVDAALEDLDQRLQQRNGPKDRDKEPSREGDREPGGEAPPPKPPVPGRT